MREYHHSHFEGATLTPEKELVLDYFDWDQGGTRLCFRYIFSLRAAPRLLTGYAHEKQRSEQQANQETMPKHIFADAEKWLSQQLIGAQSSNQEALCQALSKHLEFFSGLNHTVASVKTKT